MLFGGLLLMPASAAAASAVTTVNLNLREGPGAEYDVITVIPRGSSVSVDGDPESGYYPVSYNGESGYAAADFISIGGSADTDVEDAEVETDTGATEGSSNESEPAVSGGAPTGSAWVAVNRLNFRSGPSTSDGVIAVLENGTEVELTGQQSNGYWQANTVGTTGWLAAEYMATSGTPSTPDTGNDSDDAGGNDNAGNDGDSVAVGGNATGSATTTVNLYLRSGPSTGYGVIAVMPRGSSVELRGEPQAGFYPLSFNGTLGWASGDFLDMGVASPDPETDPTPAPDSGNGSVAVGDAATGSATVTAGLNLRGGPGLDYDVRTVMPSGATVELRGDPQGSYYPLSYNGTTGWAHGDWLNIGGASPDPDPEPEPTPNPGNGSVAVGDTATGTATVTAGLNLRGGPSMDHEVRTVMPSGATVELRGDPQGGYYPLSYNGTTGWAHGDWLNVGSSQPDPDPEPTPNPSDGSVAVGDTATGSAAVTENLNLRTGPGIDYDVRTVMPSGATVELRGDPQGAYYPLSYNGTTGWAHGDWLNIGGASPDPDPEPSPSPNPGNGSTPDYLYTEVAVNMRSAPTTDSSIVWVIPPGTRVGVTGAMQNGWYPVSWAHVTGYMHADYLVESYQRDVPADKQWIVDIIYAAADRYGQPREDMLRVAQCESHLDPSAVNMDYANDNDRASGLFQFRPSTWATTPYADQDIFNAEANANAAAWMWSVGRRNEWACQ